MKKTFTILLALIFLSTSTQAIKKDVISLIPKPVKLEIGKGEFRFNHQTKIWLAEQTDELQKLGDLLTSYIDQSTGWKLSATSQMTRNIPRSLIVIQLKKDFQSNES